VKGWDAPRGRGASPDKSKLFLPWGGLPDRKTYPPINPERLSKSKGYKQQKTYFFVLFKDGYVYDIVPVKTYTTVSRFLSAWKKRGILPLALPNPVKVPKEYWDEYRQIKGKTSRFKRIALARKFGLLKDENILNLQVITLDVDSPYKEVLPAWEELRERLGIEQGYTLVKTKRGNFRAYLYLTPTYITIELENGGKKETKIRTFYPAPKGKGRNGKTHLENAQELQAILLAFFAKRGLKADLTFAGRLNHPLWVDGWEIDGRKAKVILIEEGHAGRLYDLYRRAKKLQREEELWQLGSINLTEKFWKKKKPEERPHKGEGPQKGRIIMPPHVARRITQKLSDLEKWRMAVDRLAETYTSYRFTKVMLPAVAWAKWLGLSEAEVESYLREVIPDKRNFDEDIERAWRYAEPSEFKWFSRGDTERYVRKFLKLAKEGVPRQKLLNEVFGGINANLERIERLLREEGLVRIEKVKLTPGPGRKAYVYFLTEKGKSYLEALENQSGFEGREEIRDLMRKVSGGEDLPYGPELTEGEKKLYITPPSPKEREEQRSGRVGAGFLGRGYSSERSPEENESPENISDGGGGRSGDGGAVTGGEQEAGDEGRNDRVNRLVEGRRLHARAWVVFRQVSERLRRRGIRVVDTRWEEAEKGEVDGKKLLKLIRLLVSTDVKELNLAGWGMLAFVLVEVLREEGLIGPSVRVILPKLAETQGLFEEAPEPEDLFGDWDLDAGYEEEGKNDDDDIDIDEIPF